MNHKRFVASVALIPLAWISAAAAPAPEPPQPPQEDTRATVARWVESQQLIARERREWQEGKQLLESRIALVQQEVAALAERLAEVERADEGVTGERRRAGAEQARVEDAQAVLRRSLVGLEVAIERLEGRLPGPLREKVAPLHARMPDDPEKTQVSLAERFQNIVGILNEVAKFDNEITMINEVRTLSDGKPSEVRTIYVGLAQAYYVSAGGEAGVGTPVEDGWHWSPANELAPQVLQAVEILQNKAKPRFVPLPVTLR